MKPARVLRRPRHPVSERPFLVIWEATRACPLACLHCRAEARTARHPEELDGAGARRVMDQVADFGRPAPLFVITGGDPFQRADLTELIAYGTALGLRVAVSPSGTPTLTPESLRAVRDAGAVAVSLSLDGSTAARHDAFRGVPGVFERTLEGWRAARALGLKVQINTTASRDGLEDLADIAALVRREGAMLWSAFLLVPTGRARRLDPLTPAAIEDVLHFLHDCGAVLAVKTTEGHHFRRVALQRAVLDARGEHPVLGPLYGRLHARAASARLFEGERRAARRPPLDVSSGRGFVFVSHTGEVHPSGFLPVPAGNVKNRPLTEIYRGSPLFTALRDTSLLGGRCGACEFKPVCGGSRARAYGAGGDVLGEDPYCGYEPGSFPYQEELRSLTGAGNEAEREL
ncbi:TIGR04053 family radical SAM/SPASM domain-containing protein [Streptomyces polychromogenes]|uniref:TIGR04053 family radical SAM/SPASM domain-containing protein n=1 Tax=Streptomyces polychromogenes TaxID=67342 RepID=A0ABN0VJT0_9ACTN